jgi:DNA-binding LacI/PurR family transcriptional regulator
MDTSRVSAPMPTPSRRPGMADVARVAGVSHQTVSRVLNGSPAVRDETRTRVLAAIESLGYRRNSAARALASRRSGVVGVLAMESTLYGPASSLYAIERAARDAGYFVSIAAIEGTSRDALAGALDHLALQDVDGVIAIAPLVGAAAVLATLPADVPVVVTQGGDSATHPSVAVDQVRGAELATLHLLDEGAPTVWHVAGPDDWLEAQRRIEGWRRALAARGLHAPEPLRGDWSIASGYRHGVHLAERADVRAVFVANDHMALGVLRAFHERGVRVPDHVLVGGFDDIPEAAYFTPPLTTVRQDFLAVGRHAVELLLDRIHGVARPRGAVVVPAQLIPRQSTIGRPRPS